MHLILFRLYAKREKKKAKKDKHKIEGWNENEFKDLTQDLLKQQQEAEWFQAYKNRVTKEIKKQWVESFEENPKKFYEFLIENKKEFSKIEMCIVLANYAHLIFDMGKIYFELYIEVLEKAYLYCNCFQTIYEIKLLVNLVQFFLMHYDAEKYSKYKSKLSQLLKQFYGENEELHKKFLNATQF